MPVLRMLLSLIIEKVFKSNLISFIYLDEKLILKRYLMIVEIKIIYPNEINPIDLEIYSTSIRMPFTIFSAITEIPYKSILFLT